MTALGVILMEKSGRSPLLLVPSAGTCLRCLLVGLSSVLQNLQQWKQITPILALVGVLVFTRSFSLGMGGLPWVIVSEIFPINMKGSAGSLITLVTWLGSWINSYVLIDWNSAGTFLLFSSLSAVTIFVKAGTREEIQTSMNRFSANRSKVRLHCDIVIHFQMASYR